MGVRSDLLLEQLVRYFNDVPSIVRGELSLVMAALTEEQFLYVGGEFDYEYAVQRFFSAGPIFGGSAT